MLPKSKRLPTSEFKEVIEKGQSFHSPFLILRAFSGKKESRFSISVPKKVAKEAVARNKMRRQAYSAIRPLEKRMEKGFNAVLIMKPDAHKLSFADLSVEIEKIFVKSGFLK